MSDEDERKKLAEMMKKAARDLGEHFDCVQILCTRQEPGGDATSSFQTGVGNIFSRMAKAREWLVKQDEYARIEARKDAEDDAE